MLPMASLFFIAILFWAGGAAYRGFMKVRRNILLGQKIDIKGDEAQRWRNVFLIALGQKKMFKNWIPAVLHTVIYVSFVITQVELLEILVDGIFGTHRFFAPYLGVFYPFVIGFIEVLTLLTLFVTIAFLARRFLLKVERFQKPELKGFPTFDAALILIFELMLIGAIFTMNGADTVLQGIYPEHYHHTGFFAVSGWLGPMLFGGLEGHLLFFIERFGWWMHLGMVLVFLNWLPYSKHLHILLAFPNTYYGRVNKAGEMENLPAVMNEVKSMFGLPIEPAVAPTSEAENFTFGANDVTSLSWKNIMDAYSCTECGRCTAACPANVTGKKLSPRKVMMDVRDRAETIGYKLDEGDRKNINRETHPNDTVLTAENFSDGLSLFDSITPEEIHACTTCNACVEACPVTINPLDIILKMRRYEILTLSAGPADWTPMFTSLENSGAVWQMPTEREQWAADWNAVS